MSTRDSSPIDEEVADCLAYILLARTEDEKWQRLAEVNARIATEPGSRFSQCFIELGDVLLTPESVELH